MQGNRGRGQQGGYGMGPSGECVCPKCGYKMSHSTGAPCNRMKCPKCGMEMTRSM